MNYPPVVQPPRIFSYADITTAWNGPVYGAAYVTRSAPAAGGAYSFMQADFDSNGNLIRTYDLASGRMDCFGPTSQGAAFVVAFSGAGVDGNVLGHFAHRGKDSNGNYNTFSYILGTAVNVSASPGALNSKIYFGVMKAQSAGGGNAQPNWGMTLDGNGNALTFDSTASINTTSGSMLWGAGNVTALTATSIGLSTNVPTKLAQEQYVNKTSNYTVLASDLGTTFTNITAAGEVDFTLPAGLSSGSRLGFVVSASQIVKVIAPSGVTIRLGPTASAAAGNIASSQVGAFVELMYFASSSEWKARSVTGTGGSTGAGGWTVT